MPTQQRCIPAPMPNKFFRRGGVNENKTRRAAWNVAPFNRQDFWKDKNGRFCSVDREYWNAVAQIAGKKTGDCGNTSCYMPYDPQKLVCEFCDEDRIYMFVARRRVWRHLVKEENTHKERIEKGLRCGMFRTGVQIATMRTRRRI